MSAIRHRYERVMELAANGEIEVLDWKKHGELDALYIHASPAWVCFRRIIFCESQLPTCQVQKNINNPSWNPFNIAARKANNEAAARQYLEQRGATVLFQGRVKY